MNTALLHQVAVLPSTPEQEVTPVADPFTDPETVPALAQELSCPSTELNPSGEIANAGESQSGPATPDTGRIRCSLFNGCKDNTPKALNFTWHELTSPACLGRVFKATGATKEEAKQKLPAFSPASYPEGVSRGDANVESIQLFMLDFDNKAEQPTGEYKENGEPVFEKRPIPGAPKLSEASEHLAQLGIAHFGYTTSSSTPGNERFRLLIPLDRPSDGKNWKAVSEWLLAQLEMLPWRSMGCIDLGCLHRAASLYYCAGYWDQQPEAKDQVQFVSIDGASLRLPSEEDLEGFELLSSPTHPLRAEWAAKMAAQHSTQRDGTSFEQVKAFNVDFTTMDVVQFFTELGSTVQAPRPNGKGFKAPCTCPFASEHTEGKDNGDAVIFYGDGWPKFKCMHDVHKDLGFLEVCLQAGPEMVQRFAKPFRVATRTTKTSQDSEAVDPEIVDEKPKKRTAKEIREERHQSVEAQLMAENIDPTEIVFTEGGAIANILANAYQIVLDSPDTLGLVRANQLRHIHEINIEECRQFAVDDYDNRISALMVNMQRKWQVNWSRNYIEHAVNLVAEKFAYHPVRDWLEALPAWDQVNRIELIRDQILGVNQTPDFDAYKDLYATMLRCTLIGAVRRIFEPGCKLDTVTLLFSAEQGAGKSTFWKMLCADPSWFNDSQIHIDNVEGYKVLNGFWFHEMAETDDMTSKKSAEAIKTFVSSSVDSFRPSYERNVRSFPRRSIIVGTTNKEQVLNDPTGSRRFWVIPTALELHLELLPPNLDQIWAQALYLYRAGEQHWLTREQDILREEQARPHNMPNRFEEFIPAILTWFNGHARPNGVRIMEIFEFIDESQKDASKRAKGDQREMAACLRLYKWTSKRVKLKGSSLVHWTPPADLVAHQPIADMDFDKALKQAQEFGMSGIPGFL